ncbi:hypothetical protein AMATHDRAFT_49263 [Amanita thiersii Skay4041]|uniref:Uncharacterized protein n=1 Tax=Amanita thiersii Skay4041 TaxID=703135 RepID=A0A2A9NFC2_9AGAR|nr:hypothetical protein AMATHDRAFT_49263 [Amanita thiersii Skay4041]
MNQSVANAITPTPKRLKFSRWYSSSRRARTLSRASSTRSTPASAAASLPGSGGSSSPVSDKDCHQSADVSRAQAPEPIREPPQGEPRSPTPDSADKYQGEPHSMPNHAASPNEETKRRG